MPSKTFSEEEYGKRIDRCFTDAIVKGSGGLLIGATLSLLLFRRRSWPIIMGTGFGIGAAFKNCERELNSINSS
ncbi:MICOS complex subunit Mic10-like [Condylostylus longicornis]|uniref:MICOS complex subunit Mic10-like n=1 Tax=Condylostylus longicornis TaxID=2530218 RepID=UPI00244E43F6|nr:MICOS complex subunit Mic10-like [Condylostylus longicornis]